MSHQLHLGYMVRGERPPLSLPISSSISCASKQRPLLLTLLSELALLLVARGESETLTVRLRDGPDRTLYIEEAGIFVIKGRKLPGMLRLISCSSKVWNVKQEYALKRSSCRSVTLLCACEVYTRMTLLERKDKNLIPQQKSLENRWHTMCLMAISRDFLDSVLPKPKLSGDEDFPDRFPRGECLSSCLGGANLRMLITLSTIFVPTNTGLMLSLALACIRLIAGTEPPLK